MMTNREKYMEELSQIHDCVALVNGKPVDCGDVDCDECEWDNAHCGMEYRNWLDREATLDKGDVKQMSIEDYCVFSSPTAPWYKADEIVPPITEQVIVLRKDGEKAVAQWSDGSWGVSSWDKFFTLDGRCIETHGKNEWKTMPKGWYQEIAPVGKKYLYQEIEVDEWTPLPTYGHRTEIMNVWQALRRYFKQNGKNAETTREAMKAVMEVYGEEEMTNRRDKILEEHEEENNA